MERKEPMDKSQWYIGTQNGIVLCIDRVEGRQVSGRFYHRFEEEATGFANLEQMLFQFERFFDGISFPYLSTAGRTFQKNVRKKEREQKRAEKMSDRELLKKHGELGTFIVRVQPRQNSSWQGRITWMEEDRTLCFRSVWEMIKLIASAVEVTKEETEEEEPSWFEEGKNVRE